VEEEWIINRETKSVSRPVRQLVLPTKINNSTAFTVRTNVSRRLLVGGTINCGPSGMTKGSFCKKALEAEDGGGRKA